jgi:hypothetical protein
MPTVSRTLALPAFSRQRVLIFSVLWLLSIAPFFLLHSQWITGPFVNAVLILATVILGPAEAIVIGLFPSAIALASGLLPLPLAPMVPFIMISNAIFVGSFHFLRSRSSVAGVIAGSALKFTFLSLAARFIVAKLTPTLTLTLLAMMGWPQLITALIGGFVALAILTPFKSRV